MTRLFTGLFYAYTIILWILSGVTHLWTVYIAYEIEGWFWGFVTLCFPVASQVYWGYITWSNFGFDSLYMYCLLLVLGLWIINYVVILFISKE